MNDDLRSIAGLFGCEAAALKASATDCEARAAEIAGRLRSRAA